MIRYFWNILAAIGGTSIELFEWTPANVKLERLPRNSAWSHFSTHRGSLPLTGIGLAHAVVRADFLMRRNYALPSLGFLLQMDQIIDFAFSSNLRLFPGAASVLADVTQSSVIGRVGQGLSLLFAESRGYDFMGHLASDPSVVAHIASAGRIAVADFLFEHAAGARMILESKATFSLLANTCPGVKTVLKNALVDQVEPLLSIVTPTPSKGFALYSCLRETGNATPSAIVFVDPPGEKGDVQIELPPDWTKRQNYAGWLRAMGLPDAADRLAPSLKLVDGASDPQPITMRTAVVQDREFAVLTLREWAYPEMRGRFAMGIDAKALRAVSAAIRGDEGALEALEMRNPKRQAYEMGRGLPLSVHRDGSLFGMIDLMALREYETFLL